MNRIAKLVALFICFGGSVVHASSDRWLYHSFADDFTDETHHIAVVASKDTPEASLAFRCMGGDLRVDINVNEILNERAPVVVRYRVDTEEAERFPVDHPMLVDHKRLMNTPREHVIELLEAVRAGRDSILIALYSSNGGGQARFPLSGAAEVVGEVLANCGIE